jgi:hypothetical protein
MSDLIKRLRSIGDRVIECVHADAMNRVADYMTEVDDLCKEAADRVAELEAENARLWAWHDAVMAQKQHLESGRTFNGLRWEYVAIARPQPLTKGK